MSDCVPSFQVRRRLIDFVDVGTLIEMSALSGMLNGSLASHGGRSKRRSGSAPSRP
jgi:hypothetical protein